MGTVPFQGSVQSGHRIKGRRPILFSARMETVGQSIGRNLTGRYWRLRLPLARPLMRDRRLPSANSRGPGVGEYVRGVAAKRRRVVQPMASLLHAARLL